MRRDEVLLRLKDAKPEIRAFGVGTLHLFESVAGDETGEASDGDLLVESSTASLFNPLLHYGYGDSKFQNQDFGPAAYLTGWIILSPRRPASDGSRSASVRLDKETAA